MNAAEKNTFIISSYIASPLEATYDYLCRLENLGEWTLYSRMKEQIDESTWRGSSSGYQADLYYHIRKTEGLPFRGIEWHCGIEYDKYFQIYPVFLFPPHYIEPGSDEEGVYFHWVSFADPRRCRPMFMEGIQTVHTSECRSLKGALERRAGRSEAARGRYRIETVTIFVDAPVELGAAYLSDVRNLKEWAHLLRAQGDVGPEAGDFVDEYGQRVRAAFRAHALDRYHMIEHDYTYPDHGGFMQRSPALLIPCSYAFNDPSASGFVLHRITFWRTDEAPRRGRLLLEDYGAESMNIKRFLEAQAGNVASFERGWSYIPK
ncbi:scytonemin biosynthesis cyclase/decarboxylase ScyC [Polyangium aurulentum]|uniref:scytonemin biosynthesis cyclase/decarboxylase ScyC n=1 Tax=Polyangium aurulentum TaxID=2567896 RepID=UPI0010AECE43|nr:scytonemin biosynthesis cyclase/decarboxylase ScyC [Polyangium aurulentum]UQA61628.1 scytonemin biosynthesis cyclase/decarboxylase ScyC [Polyangium aurulentum]